MIRGVRHDEQELATAIRLGASRRPEQAFGQYFAGSRSSCALGAAYEGMYRLPRAGDALRPQGLERLFDCLENTIRRCPQGCRKTLPLAAIIVHLNDDHHWDREQIATWLAGTESSSAPSA